MDYLKALRDDPDLAEEFDSLFDFFLLDDLSPRDEADGRATFTPVSYTHLFWLKKKPHPPVDVASPLRPFHALRQPVQVTGSRRAFFYFLKGV